MTWGLYMEEMSAAIEAVSSPAVGIWINWMGLIFLASLIFVYRHVSARFILGTIILTAPLALVIFKKTGSPHLIGVAHILLWLPLGVYLVKTEVLHKTVKLRSAYGVYLVLLLATITISLVFDIRDTLLILLGMKDPYL
jgi:hypothetical protein